MTSNNLDFVARCMIGHNTKDIKSLISEVENIQNDIGGVKIVQVTKEDYDALTDKPTNVIYLVSDGDKITLYTGDEPSGTVTNVAVANGGGLTVSGSPITTSGTITVGHSNSVTAKTSSSLKKFSYDPYGHVTGSSELSTDESNALASGIDSTKVAQITTNKNNILLLQQEQITQNREIATNTNNIAVLRDALDAVVVGCRIDKLDTNPDTRVQYMFDAVGLTPAYMDFTGGFFNYGSFGSLWCVEKNRPVALTFGGEVDYELSHTDFTKKIDGVTDSKIIYDAEHPENTYSDGNFMSEMPTVYVKRWEDERYNYFSFSNKKLNEDYLAQAHTNANNNVNPYIYLPMFKGWKDSNNKLRSLMGTYPTGNTTGQNEVTYASNNGTGWQIWDKAKIDLIMDLIMLITKSTNCRAKIGNGGCQTYNTSDTTNYGKMKSGYETDGTTRSANAQFYGSEGTDSTNYGKHHMIAFYIEDLWANRWDRCLGFNLVDNVYKVKMTPPYALDSDGTYQSLTVTPPSSTEGWLKNVSSGVYGDVPTEVGASNTSGFANHFNKNASGNRLSLFGGVTYTGLKVGRFWGLDSDSGGSYWAVGGSPCYNSAT